MKRVVFIAAAAAALLLGGWPPAPARAHAETPRTILYTERAGAAASLEAKVVRAAAEVAALEARAARSAAERDKKTAERDRKASEEAKVRLRERRTELSALRARAAEVGKMNRLSARLYSPRWAGGDVRVSLDFGGGATVRDALKAALDQAKQEYVLDEDLPGDRNVTLKVQNARLETVLDLLTQTAGVGWRREVRDGKTVIRVGKSIPAGQSGLAEVPVLGNLPIVGDLFRNRDNPAKLPDVSVSLPYTSYVLSRTEQRSTFTCPHCKGQTTVVRRNQQPKCPTCTRMFEAGWKFCPADGTKRPPTPGAWRFCPMCGKTVRMEQGLVPAPQENIVTFGDTRTKFSISTPTPHAP